MRGLSDSDIHNESTGETMGQYWKRQELEGYKVYIEWFSITVASILILALSLTVF